MINDNFFRKYIACYGVVPKLRIYMESICIINKNKCVQYKNFYISGWKGIYHLYGERKYLDFLYQTGLGMFMVLEQNERGTYQ